MGLEFGAFVLAVNAFFGLYTFWGAATRPERFAGQLGLTIANPGGLNEIRSQYAGFFLVMGLFCAATLAGFAPRATAFIVLALVFGGLIGGRLVSLLINGGMTGFTPAIRALYVIDSIGLGLALAALRLNRA